jgi:hypothetical protein
METPRICLVDVDRLNDGILVTFSNDILIFITAETLWDNRHLGEEPIIAPKENPRKMSALLSGHSPAKA